MTSDTWPVHGRAQALPEEEPCARMLGASRCRELIACFSGRCCEAAPHGVPRRLSGPPRNSGDSVA